MKHIQPNKPVAQRRVLYEMPPRRGNPPTARLSSPKSGDIREAVIVGERPDFNGRLKYDLRGVGERYWSAYDVPARSIVFVA